MDLHASTYTFLFTDIEGSTRYWEHQPEAMRASLERHNEILRRAIEGNGGWVFRTAGDAFHASFKTATAALAAAAEAQRKLYTQEWELEGAIRVRMALHSGEAEEKDGDYVGGSLNRIGRLISVCHGGQTLLTQATQELVRDNLPEGVTLLDLGRHRFRDLIYPERVFQAAIEGLPANFPPLKSLEAIPNNIPTQLTSFIGRESELDRARELLSEARLLTLTGPGGTGKTRLALQAAAAELEAFPDGVWVVELASLSDPAQVIRSAAGVLNIREHPEMPIQESIKEALRSRRLLLVLDNCEHLIEACAQMADTLLRSCPELKILASSREVLGIPGETTLRVPPLSLPDISRSISVEELASSEAVQLFVERAKAALPNFALNGQNAASIAAICWRLDGIPLAIELAAARVRLLKPEQIADRLDNLFRLLTGGSRTALPRQRTLEAMIDWSHDLLSEAERALFRRLSVFLGGWTLEAAEQVCTGDGQSGGDKQLAMLPEPTLDLLAQLVNKSLVVVDERESEARYRLLETIRQYAQNKLVDSGEATQLRDNHLRYFKKFSDQAQAGLMGEDQPGWYDRLERDHDNFRAALDWGQVHDPESVLEIGSNLVHFWSGRGYASEGRRRLQAGLEGLEGMEREPEENLKRQKIVARALNSYGEMAIVQGDHLAARQALERCVEILREIGESKEMVFSTSLLSLAYLFLGEIEQSQELAEEGVRLGRELGEPIGLALSLSILAQINVRSPDGQATAREQIEESARLIRAHGNRWFSALSLLGLGIVAHLAMDLDTATRHFLESREIFLETGDQHFSNASLSYIADVARLRGEFDQATRLYQETIGGWLKLGHRGGVARCLECLAFMTAAQAYGSDPEVSSKVLQRAATLLGAAETIREASGAGATIDEQLEYWEQVSALRAKVEEDAQVKGLFEKAWDRGRMMDLDEALEFAQF